MAGWIKKCNNVPSFLFVVNFCFLILDSSYGKGTKGETFSDNREIVQGAGLPTHLDKNMANHIKSMAFTWQIWKKHGISMASLLSIKKAIIQFFRKII